MNMQEKLKDLITELEPGVRSVVAEVIALERDYLDFDRPQVKEEIRAIIDRYARQSEADT